LLIFKQGAKQHAHSTTHYQTFALNRLVAKNGNSRATVGQQSGRRQPESHRLKKIVLKGFMMLTRFRNIAFVLAYAVATIPLWHYSTDAKIILLMTLVIGFAYLNVVLSSVDAAQAILTSEKAKITLPRWLPKSPKYQKWWAIRQRTLRWHLLLIPAKLGLALGCVQWLHLGSRAFTWSILKPYFYASNSGMPMYSQWETLLLGGAIIVLFTILECGLISALTILTPRPSRVVVLRLLIVLAVMGVMSQYRLFAYARPSDQAVCAYAQCTTPCDNDCNTRRNIAYYELRQRNRRIGETVITSFFTFDDMGVLLAANIMRPVGIDSAFAVRYESNGDGTASYIRDNRPFVARQLVAGLLGVLLYGIGIFATLRFVRNDDLTPQPDI
jgi:hypothetical protein